MLGKSRKTMATDRLAPAGMTPASLRYGLAAVSSAAALGVASALGPGNVVTPVFFPAVVLSAWFGGTGPGLLAVLLATLAVDYFFLPPLYEFAVGPVEGGHLAAFAFSALMMSWLTAGRRHAEAMLRESHGAAEAMVRERTAELQQANERLQAEMAERQTRQELLEFANRAAGISAFNWDIKRDVVTTLVGDEPNHGIDPNQDGGSYATWTRSIHPEDRPPIESALRRAFQTGELFTECRTIWPDGSVHWLLEVGRVIFDAEGGPARLVELRMDTTERKRAEAALREAAAELAHVTRVTTMGELTATIAHEVNQPLTAVAANANACLRWLAGDAPNLDEACASAQRIIRDAHRASEVIGRVRGLLTRTPPTGVALDVNDIVEETAALVRGEAQRRQTSVTTDLAARLRPVVGDRVQLQQVLLNLIMNGIEAMGAVTERPRRLVIRTGQSEANSLVVTVQDCGTGIDPEHAQRLFEPFFSTKPDGLGMGLSVCRTIVERHGGRLWVVPNAGFGATFHVSLPVADELTCTSRTA
jgi:signal transduction histidine kinase